MRPLRGQPLSPRVRAPWGPFQKQPSPEHAHIHALTPSLSHAFSHSFNLTLTLTHFYSLLFSYTHSLLLIPTHFFTHSLTYSDTLNTPLQCRAEVPEAPQRVSHL